MQLANGAETFIEQLIAEKNFQNADNDFLQTVRENLAEELTRRMNGVILLNLPKEKLAEFESMLDSVSDGDIYAFCQENIPDLNRLVADDMLAFRREYLGI